MKYNVTIEEVYSLCDSKDGSSFFKKSNMSYIVLYNDICNSNGRILWTLAHELGHIVLEHLIKLSELKLNDEIIEQIKKTFETEADYFAANLLAPFRLFRILNINSVIDLQNKFGLSNEASINRWNGYLKWEKSHIKTAFDTEIVKIYSG